MMGSGLPWTHSKTSNNSKTCGGRVLLLGKCGNRTRTRLGQPQLILFVSLHALFKLGFRPGGSTQHTLFRSTFGRYRDWLWRDDPLFGPEISELRLPLGCPECRRSSGHRSSASVYVICWSKSRSWTVAEIIPGRIFPVRGY